MKQSQIIALIIGVVLLFPVIATTKEEESEGLSFLGRSDLPLGLRNNNPGNIKASPDNWQGEIGTDSGFEVFKSVFWGLRALFKNLKTYYFRYGLNTIEKIINRWAPPSENDTESYIQFVSYRTGVDPKKEISWNHFYFVPIAGEIVKMENGIQYAGLIPGQLYMKAFKAV